MLETIREYAAQRLTDAGAVANLKDAHGQWFLTLAKALAPTLMNPESLDQIELDHGNFRAALHHLTDISPQSHLELANALARFWWQRGYLNEGRTWLEGALANAAPDISLLRANALHQAEWLASSQGDDESAQKLAEEALVIYRALGEDQRAAFTLNTLGAGAAERGDLPQAEQYYEQARSFFVEHGVDLGLAMVNGNMGELALQRGHPHEAVSFARAALDLSRQAGFSEGVVGSLHTLGVAAFMEDDLEQASHSLEEALRFASQFGYREFLASCLDAVAAVARRKGHAEHAASLFGFLEVFRAETGIPGPRLVRELHAQAIAELEDELGRERMSDLATAGRTMNVDEAVELALSSVRAREGAESQ
jgi:tetratricopeptide (TPR) repeat protein